MRLAAVQLLALSVAMAAPTSRAAQGSIKLPPILSDGMILQRDRPIAFWGTAAPGAAIEAECDGGQASAKVGSDGKWTLKLPPHAAGGPFVATIRSGEEVVAIHDVHFGEVWLAGGQSNMQMNVMESSGYSPAADPADSLLRFYETPRAPTPKFPDDNGILAPHEGMWLSYAPERAVNFSAVAYYYARTLREKLGVPVAIIGCDSGGTPAESWVSREVLKTQPEWQAGLDFYDKAIASKTSEQMESEYRDYLAQMEDYHRALNLSRTAKPPGPKPVMPKGPPVGPFSKFRPASLYEGMIRTVVPYAIHGFIFYQGESNAGPPHAHYADLFSKLIGLWRQDWGDENLPFYFVQISTWGQSVPGNYWPVIRDAQDMVAHNVPHTGMAVSLDLGIADNPHYPDKKTVGDRLARIALNQTYGLPVPYLGPRFKSARRDGSKLSLAFSDTGSGLQTKNSVPAVDGFEVKTSDGKVIPIAGSITAPDTVSFTLPPEALKIEEVRYGWEDFPDPRVNLYNADDLPAEPFHVTESGAAITDGKVE